MEDRLLCVCVCVQACTYVHLCMPAGMRVCICVCVLESCLKYRGLSPDLCINMERVAPLPEKRNPVV